MKQIVVLPAVLMLAAASRTTVPARPSAGGLMPPKITKILIQANQEKRRNASEGIRDLFSDQAFIDQLPELPETLRDDPDSRESYS